MPSIQQKMKFKLSSLHLVVISWTIVPNGHPTHFECARGNPYRQLRRRYRQETSNVETYQQSTAHRHRNSGQDPRSGQRASVEDPYCIQNGHWWSGYDTGFGLPAWCRSDCRIAGETANAGFLRYDSRENWRVSWRNTSKTLLLFSWNRNTSLCQQSIICCCRLKGEQKLMFCTKCWQWENHIWRWFLPIQNKCWGNRWWIETTWHPASCLAWRCSGSWTQTHHEKSP